MFMRNWILCCLLELTNAQFPPTPKGIRVLKSKFHENVTISYKEPGICEITPGVRSYSGYVHLPPEYLDDISGEVQNYPINTFFWFFEARKDPENAPLAIWLNGGPGASSLMGLLEENGPCLISTDSKTTYLNPWSWNNEVNMLYIDQPNQVGFSYDVPTNGTTRVVEMADGPAVLVVPSDFSDGVPASNFTNRVGTFGSQTPSHTANTTLHAAHAVWHFIQAWFFEFPHYKPNDNSISLWAESYGGHYGPGIMRFFQEQNEKIRNGTSEEKNAHYLRLDTLGIVNGLIDMVIQGEAYRTFPFNNTYDIQAFSEDVFKEVMEDWTRLGGCKDQIQSCQDALKQHGPLLVYHRGFHQIPACERVEDNCWFKVIKPYLASDHGWYDIGHPRNDPFPPPGLYGYLTQESVLSALGVPVNFSFTSGTVSDGFMGTHDPILGGFLDAIGYLLDSGVKVHMMYGDRDYACSWVGGEKASLAVPYSRTAEFAAAGYTPLLTEDGVSGFTRQLGNYSFSRVFQAGHEVPSYQPAAAYAIFTRAMFNRDVPTGIIPLTDEFVTVGMKNTWAVRNIAPERPTPKCYILKPETCSPSDWERVKAGTAVVKDWFVVSDAGGGGEVVSAPDDVQNEL